MVSLGVKGECNSANQILNVFVFSRWLAEGRGAVKYEAGHSSFFTLHSSLLRSVRLPRETLQRYEKMRNVECGMRNFFADLRLFNTEGAQKQVKVTLKSAIEMP